MEQHITVSLANAAHLPSVRRPDNIVTMETILFGSHTEGRILDFANINPYVANAGHLRSIPGQITQTPGNIVYMLSLNTH